MIINKFLTCILLSISVTLGVSPALARDENEPRAAKNEPRAAKSAMQEVSRDKLPSEARETLELIERGGPFPYDRDGIVFGNFERRLPQKERGYYQEYTVKTPGVKSRGARRIVAGGCAAGAKKGKDSPPAKAPCTKGERYYTDDHYKSFKQVKP